MSNKNSSSWWQPPLSTISSTLISAIASIVITVLAAILSHDAWQSLIAGLVTFILGYMITLVINIEVYNQKSSDELKAELRKTANELKNIMNLDAGLDEVYKLSRNQKLHENMVYEATIRLLGETKTWLEGKYDYEYEFDRIRIISDAVRSTTSHVKAVNHDAIDYIQGLWTNVVGEKYFNANMFAAQHGVKIQRIFVIPEDVINEKEVEKARIVREILHRQQTLPNIEIRVAVREELPTHLQKDNFNFLICDDSLASASPFIVGTDKHGYVTTNKMEIYDLNNKFEALWDARISKPLNDPNFKKFLNTK